jgi:Dockerin type I domain
MNPARFRNHAAKLVKAFAKTLAVATSLAAIASAHAGEGFGAIYVDHPMVIPQGSSESALVKLAFADDPAGLFGYSLEMKIVPRDGATGTVSFDLEGRSDPERTNLFLPQNLIAAFPAPLDPLFTVILSDGIDGVFINANIDYFSLSAPDFVTLTPDVNDVLAEIVVDVASDALGVFDIVFGPATALSDEQGFGVPYVWIGATVTALPTPDLNNDGAVNATDLAILLGQWGPCPSGCPDFNGDGQVDAIDLSLLLGEWSG